MRKLIDDLLEFSKISFSNQKFVPVDLSKVLDDITSDLELPIQEKDGKIKLSFLPVINARPSQMYQLFHNLLVNALKFSRDGVPPVIHLSSKTLKPADLNTLPSLDPARKYCEILVKDNGIGFDGAFSEQIFIIFQRLNEKKKYPGTGIGLALCKRIVTSHGGIITASADERGATFRVVLPVANN
jgi:two-component system CheB/CheR fusion protein